MSTTTNLGLTKPTVGGSDNTWGNALNANMDLLDTAVNKAMPTGGIIMWSGTVATIPTGWALCDGTNGTPNLTGKFIVHADADSSGTYNVGATGGANDVTLTTSEMPAHSHSGSTASAGSHTHTGSTNTTGAHTHDTNFSYSSTVDYFGNNVSILNNGQNGTNSVEGTDNDFTSDSAGSHSHTLSINSAGAHTHTVTVSNTGGGSAHENRPPFYALAYIMKT